MQQSGVKGLSDNILVVFPSFYLAYLSLQFILYNAVFRFYILQLVSVVFFCTYKLLNCYVSYFLHILEIR